MENKWKPGLPPDTNVDAWEVYYSPAGAAWHRRNLDYVFKDSPNAENK